MREEDSLSGELRELEEALAQSVRPVPAKVDAFAAAYSAGRKSARREVQIWRVAAGVMLAVGLGVWSFPGRGVAPPQEIARVAIHDEPIVSASPVSVIMLRQAMAEKGMDGLPEAQIPAASALRVSDGL